MLIDFFLHLKARGLSVSIKEFLALLEALQLHVIEHSLDDFYVLSRATLVKDETHFDKFDRAFGEYFKGIEALPGMEVLIPDEWLRQAVKRHLTDAERAKLEKLGWDKLMETFRQRLAEQKERHAGGSKWIGSGGTSPFGHGGTHPEGIRVGGRSENRSAVKVWDRREYRNLDDSVEIGTRNIKVALRRLRRFARQGAPEELDLEGTITGTARNAGWLDLKLRPERHNAVKVLLFLDVGGSMDDHIRVCEELFSACRSEFKHLEHYYFHNCVYDHLWRDNRRRHSERIPTLEVMHRYGNDYKLIFVGDAAMSPYELVQPGGSLEYDNVEPGAAWLRRLTDTWPHAIWLNPESEHSWPYRQSTSLIHNLLGGRMFPLTLDGLERGMRLLSK
ncbi:VWA domain-containing protein [Accumulibacter sp.]|uniref:vWA domain-containing protein n=1 Tax=Accumulibacter sp. TaxID=2053492 RepID=UPI0026008214|nr:VWA domain-containing protein [Accumulibacter sp.]MCM8596035.1 VWA domain-containing protein [Accumulibacter sp.]MCM8627064.1 VWA domain-containing protein [Accumulibacter sp.]MDS4050184.1 VWA domain-containing protein [Accumulibacter sp.]